MKKTTALLLIFALLFSFSGCKSSGAEKTVDNFLKAMQSANYQEADSHLTAPFLEELFEEVEGIGGTQKTIYDSMKNFKYQLGNLDEVTENESTIAASLEILDYGRIMQELFAHMVEKSYAGTDETDEEIEEALTQELLEILKDKDRELSTIDCKVTVEKIDGQWKIDPDKNYELINAVFGNLLATMGGLGL